MPSVRPASSWPRFHSESAGRTNKYRIVPSFLSVLLVATAISFVSGLSARIAAAQTASSSTASVAPPQLATSKAGDFTSQVGVVTHLSYTNTPYYTQFPKILAALKTLGVKHIRDGYYPWPESSPIVQAHWQLAAAGIKTDYVIPYDLATSPADIEQFAGEVRDMGSVEAPNECDISGQCNGTGDAGVASAVSFMPTVHSAGNELKVPVVGPSFTQQDSYPAAGDLDSLMTVNNLHIYFGGRNPGSDGWGGYDAQGNSYGSFAWWLNQAAVDGPEMPSEITETGYMAYPSTSTPYTLPESVEASYIPRTLLLAFEHGFKSTFVYELIDEVSSPGYGLMNSNLSPKPAFTAVSNLLSLLSDSGTYTPVNLRLAISGGGPTLNHIIFEKHDGSYWLVLWLEQSSWDEVNVAPIAVTPQNIGVELGPHHKTVYDYQFDESGNVTRFNQPMTGNWASLTVTDKISVVQIEPR
jgi:hypothetical protein